MSQSSQALTVGSRVVAAVDSGRIRAGERGLVYEVAGTGERTRYGVLFEKGEHRSFSADELGELLAFTPGDVVPELTGYRFENAGRLVADFLRGQFRIAFPPQKGTALGH